MTLLRLGGGVRNNINPPPTYAKPPPPRTIMALRKNVSIVFKITDPTDGSVDHETVSNWNDVPPEAVIAMEELLVGALKQLNDLGKQWLASASASSSPGKA